MNKNRIRGLCGRTSGQMIAKSIVIKGRGGKFGGCAVKAAGLTWEVCVVSRKGTERFARIVSAAQKSAEGIVVAGATKARTMEGSKGGELTRAERQNNQLELAFSKRSEGEARSGACEGTEACVARADTERPAIFISLNPSNRHVRTRTRGGVGGEES